MNVPSSVDTEPEVAQERLKTGRAFGRLLNNRVAMVALGYLVFLALAAIIGPYVVPQKPNVLNLTATLHGPSAAHWLGTDLFGRDIFTCLIDGSRITLIAAAIGVGVGAGAGIPLGLAAGYLGRYVDYALNSVSNALMSIPPLLLAVAVISIEGPGLVHAMIAVGIILVPGFFRLSRAVSSTIRHETFVEASRSSGCSSWRILWRHLLPNASGPLLVQLSFSIGVAIYAEASLSFLGLGVQPPQPSWGGMIQDAFQTITQTSWGIYPPAIAITLTILAFSLLGDGVRDALGRPGGPK